MTPRTAMSTRSGSDGAAVVQAVTVIMGVVVGLTFLFGFGNVLNLALRLGVPVWVAPLVAPAVDLSILGLLLGTRHLALAGAPAEQLRPARRLLIFASVVTLALNVADPIVAGEYGKAAFDAVGPLLLIGWAEVGPGLLQAMSASRFDELIQGSELPAPTTGSVTRVADDEAGENAARHAQETVPPEGSATREASMMIDDDLLERARQEDTYHWAEHRRPISADTLRKRLRVGAARSRMLVSMIRASRSAQAEPHSEDLRDFALS
ncbi:hypothetical protein [Amycolatopsis saalfeldensis]|uniref:DUF2637 domain-containing protein n=1 Tax=Amycolatopsis saalfeldensis TaxID=394193 RepID=A0A1H8YPK7_9PSEU|nr:hypothetical protein [Amycolatopsis saalfeldensis]SEP53298.1 hypothetical protein SAMN04489732_12622 [Amycolatopsis saalfeldensis]